MTGLPTNVAIRFPVEGRDDLQHRLKVSVEKLQGLDGDGSLEREQQVAAGYQAEIESCLIRALEEGQEEVEASSVFRALRSRRGNGVDQDLSLFERAWGQVAAEVGSWLPPWIQAA
jgi:hypothetical protein